MSTLKNRGAKLMLYHGAADPIFSSDDSQGWAGWSATRSRPLCAYPKVARYKGSGSIELAANFECR